MKKTSRILGVGIPVCFALFGAWMLFGAKPAPNVQLRATFQAVFSGEDPTPCTFLNDDKGPYLTDGRHNVSVWLTSDAGDLFFKFEHHAERSLRIIFPPVGNECGMLPDTAGLYEGVPDEPVDFFRFATYNSFAFAEPKVNFLTMPKETPLQVRLFTTFCTTERHYFFLNWAREVGKNSGVVEVIAYDTNNNGQLDQWVLTPITGSGHVAKVYKHPETGDDSINCLFGEFPMPFKLVLTRR